MHSWSYKKIKISIPIFPDIEESDKYNKKIMIPIIKIFHFFNNDSKKEKKQRMKYLTPFALELEIRNI